MQMSDAVEIKQVFGESLVNSHLRDGWKLLAVTSSSYGDNGKHLPCYVLGKPAPEVDPNNPIRQQFIAAGAFGNDKKD